ncbi:DUF885 domain-containing protein [Alteromonas sp. ASW11-130]|uniref:DUF885 domain-containing protein n=1 Tax=Alteromonas sp. ASW11-130 TaxID=3015775 RepID=UPI0022420E0B|nr:DUF885 domain-containing protein [Alteromonas sp. ASW11-130]MCW8091193.1 DUF885 domain-containing protein [Alteromonas sp. ASW11-130]
MNTKNGYSFFCLITLLFLFGLKANAAESESKKLTTLLDEIWKYELQVSPLMASREGEAINPDKLADISPAALKKQHQTWQQFLSRLATINTSELSDSEQISLLMQQYRLENYIDEYRFNAHLVPITSEYGFHSAMASLPRSMHLKDEQDFEHYLSRLAAIEANFEQNIAYMREGMRIGLTQPKVVLAGFEESVTPYLVDDPSKSDFYAPFKTMPAHLSDAKKKKFQDRAKAVIKKSVIPAYQMVYDFLVSEYIPNGRSDIAAKSWPDGEDYYQNRIKHYTTTEMSAKDIHALGLSEVKRIRAEMQTIVDKLEFNGSIDEFIHFLRTDPQFYATSAEELLKAASFIAKKMDAKLPQLFEFLPRTPYGVEAVPESIAPKYTTGRYISPSRDDQPGYYWVNTYALDKRPLYALTALTLHEAVPGHHLQISLAAEMKALPKVRQNTYISAFGEGWGLYSEYLGIETDMYKDPYDDFGRLSYEMWRACRLVVDTGMHMFGWSRQQAIDFMLTNTALSEHNVRTEIDRYISWPGQALSYKIGEIKIKALRNQAEEKLGSHFDVRKFHRAVLEHGSVPLFILEKNINTFIQSELTKVK